MIQYYLPHPAPYSQDEVAAVTIDVSLFLLRQYPDEYPEKWWDRRPM